MIDEFVPEASVDFEALAAAAAAEVNGDGPHYAPPPDQAPPAAPPIRPHLNGHQAPQTSALHGGDPFAQLEAVSRELPLMYKELGDINVSLIRLQLTTALALGSALLLAVLVWKLSHHEP